MLEEQRREEVIEEGPKPLTNIDMPKSLNALVLFERYNSKHIDHLLENCKNKMNKQCIGSLIKMKKNSKKTKGKNILTRECCYTIRNGGRYYTSYGLQNINSDVRNFISGEFYHDIDIANCQFTIFRYFCARYKLDKPLLDDYCKRRKEILKNYSRILGIKQSEVKTMVTAFLFERTISKQEHELCMKLDDYPEFIKLREELNENTKTLTTVNEFKEVYQELVKNAKNQKKRFRLSSFLNRILEQKERELITVIISFLKEKNFKIGCLIHDGVLVMRNESKKFDEKILRECEQRVKEATKIPIRIKEKSMDSTFVFEEINKEGIHYDPVYLKMKEEFEEYNCKIQNPVMFVNWSGEEMYLKNKTNMKDLYENKPFPSDKKEEKSFINIWLKDPNMRTYDRMDFVPNNNDPTILNTFKGFLAESIETEEIIEEEHMCKYLWDLRWHLKNLCNDNEEYVEWLFDYCAHMVGKPEEKPGIAINMKSEEGEGKNTFWEWFMNKVLHPDYLYVTSNLPEIFDKFSIGLKDKLCVIIEETDGAAGFKYDERIKGMITCSRDKFEQKGVQAFSVNSLIRYIFFSNNETSRKVTGSNRRDVFFEGTGRYAGGGTRNPDYFKRLYKYLYNPLTIKTFYNFLKKRFEDKQITKETLWETRPITETQKEMSMATIPKEIYFFKNEFTNILEDDDDDNEVDKTLNYEHTKSIYGRYKRYMENNFSKYPAKDLRNFGKTLSKIDFDKKRNNGSQWLLEKHKFEEYCKRKNYLIERIDVD